MYIFQKVGLMSVFMVAALGAMEGGRFDSTGAGRPNAVVSDQPQGHVDRFVGRVKRMFNWGDRSVATPTEQQVRTGARLSDEAQSANEQQERRRREDEARRQGRPVDGGSFESLAPVRARTPDIKLSQETQESLQSLHNDVLVKINANKALAANFNKVFKLADFTAVIREMGNSGKITAENLEKLNQCKRAFIREARTPKTSLDVKLQSAEWTAKNADDLQAVMLSLSKVSEQLSGNTVELGKVQSIDGILKEVFLNEKGMLSEKAIEVVEGVNFLDRKNSTGAQIVSGAVAVLAFTLFVSCIAFGAFAFPLLVVGALAASVTISLIQEQGAAMDEAATGQVKIRGQGQKVVSDWRKGKGRSAYSGGSTHASVTNSTMGMMGVAGVVR